MLIKTLIQILFFLFSTIAFGEYKYELVESNGHRVHVVVIDPNEYEASLVAGHNQVFGRERVGDIADRENAQIAINAGFFEIGDIEDGWPTGTLVSNGQVFGMRTTQHGCLVKRGNKFTIEIFSPALEINFAGQKIKPAKFNKFAKGKNVFYFNSNWGPKTLSPYQSRQEMVLDAQLKVVDIANHGNNEIPQGGYVLSFPKDFDLSSFNVGQVAEFNWSPHYFVEKDSFAVMGIPPLILNGKIRDDLSNEQRHARTAVGVDKDGNLIAVVAEHSYKRPIAEVTTLEIQKIMEKRKIAFSDITIADAKKIILEDLSSEDEASGFTTLELAKFMQELGCIAAINLDGGGSSTLYIDGKYINKAVGDVDEAAGQAVFRPISDAIIFKKRPN